MGVCLDAPRECPTGCSGRGACLFIDRSTRRRLQQKDCSVSNDRCAAVCECDEGFFGEDCAQDQDEMEELVSIQQSVY